MLGLHTFANSASENQPQVKPEMLLRLPIARKLVVIVCVFVAIVVCVFTLGILRSQVLNGARAYVAGEGLWSKAEKRAARKPTFSSTSPKLPFRSVTSRLGCNCSFPRPT
jgi:hypothetical protein